MAAGATAQTPDKPYGKEEQPCVQASLKTLPQVLP
jgi:hypothetical protein